MKGRALIEELRAPGTRFVPREGERDLLADAVEIADEACWELIVSECLRVDPWWNTQISASNEIDYALSYLDRRGLIGALNAALQARMAPPRK